MTAKTAKTAPAVETAAPAAATLDAKTAAKFAKTNNIKLDAVNAYKDCADAVELVKTAADADAAAAALDVMRMFAADADAAAKKLTRRAAALHGAVSRAANACIAKQLATDADAAALDAREYAKLAQIHVLGMVDFVEHMTAAAVETPAVETPAQIGDNPMTAPIIAAAIAAAPADAPAVETAPAPSAWDTARADMRRRLAIDAAVRTYPMIDHDRAAARWWTMRDDDIAVSAFRAAAAAVGLEDLTDAAPAVENGAQYQNACVVLTKGRGKNADTFDSVRIPATRGRVNVLAWYTSLCGYVPSPIECPNAYVQCDPTAKNSRIYRADNDTAVCVKVTKDGRPIARKVGIEAFIKRELNPIIGAWVFTATDSGRYHVGYSDAAHVVTF